MHCVKCGAAVPDGAAFCPGCGESTTGLPTPKPTVAADPLPKRKSSFGKGCFAAVGVVVALLIVLAIVAPTPKKTDSASSAADKEENAVANADPADLPLAVTAKELWGAYQGNEASAQSYFGNRRLYVTGIVDRVQLDFLNHPEILLRTPNQFESVQAALAADARDQANAFSPGDKVQLLCEDVTEVVATPMLKDCRNAPAGVKTQPIQWSK